MLREPGPDAIRRWPIDERPRERLLRHGSAALTTAELLAVILRTGTRGQSAVALARALLRQGGGLRGLDQAEIADFPTLRGLGRVKAAQVKAALELGKRLLSEAPRARGRIGSSRDAYDLLRPGLSTLPREVCQAVFLDGNNGILEVETVSEGSLTESAVYVRDLIQRALRHRAAALIFAHNHPSGTPRPSPGDKAITEELVFAGRLMQVRVLDHVIIGAETYFSFADSGHIAQYEAAYARRRRPHPEASGA